VCFCVCLRGGAYAGIVTPRLRLAALDKDGTRVCVHNPQENSLLVVNVRDRTVAAISVRRLPNTHTHTHTERENVYVRV
jgi:hypothetical protein